jgi:aspartate aminotransferase
MYSAEELGALADIAIEHNLTVISDEIYEHLVYGTQKFASFASVRPGLQDRVITVNGVSKSYAMTGWRIGWTLSPANIATAMADLQSQETSNPCSVSQYAALAALEDKQDCVQQMLAAFTERREYVRGRIAKIAGLSCSNMDGAFYAFVNIKQHLGRKYGDKQIDTCTDWCLELLERHGVATVMGSAFGAPGYARLSFATDIKTLTASFDAIEAFLAGK